MRRFGKLRLSLRQRLLLLTIIPIFGLMAVGGMSFRTLHAEYQDFARDAQGLAAFRVEVAEFDRFVDVICLERDAALKWTADRRDLQRLADYRACFAATDRAVTELMAKLDRLAGSAQAALFADKNKGIRSFIASQLPDARAGALDPKRSSGDVFFIYMKIAYSALGVSECYRPTIHTPPGSTASMP